MNVPAHARLVRVPLEGGPEAAEGALLVRDDERPFALAGDWAGGGALVGSEPLVVASPEDDPFALLDVQPVVEAGALAGGAPEAVGGGWFGYLGYSLGATLEPVPPSPPRPAPLPRFALAFYDHLLRLDSSGRWWFEALWSDERDAALRERLQILTERMAAGVRERPVEVGPFAPVAPGASGHVAAVAECRERIAAGEIFQANLCLRLEGRWSGEPVDLFARTARTLEPRHAGMVAGSWGAVCSLSPELFLRRRGRRVVTEPIKGTAPRLENPETLAASPKDRAENVMIVDLMRNDLGRVCEYGSVSVDELAEPRPAPGVWHLVSTVAGTLRPEVGDAELLRASFPAGSVTGAPKIQTMRVIAELEATAREAYTGAIGYASPLAGLELNVAIRTLETSGDRIWLGAGGGIVADSDPEAELGECLVKGRPVVEAAGGRLAGEAPGAPVGGRLRGEAVAAGGGRHGTARSGALPGFALAGGASRPDPARGVFSTMLVADGAVLDLSAHLERLRASARELYGRELPAGLERRVIDAAQPHRRARLRVVLAVEASPEVEVDPLPDAGPTSEPVHLAPALLPGGLGDHKWLDRRLLEELARRLGAVPLLVDFDGEVLEAAHANVWIREGRTLVTPPLDGRLLPGTVRARLLADPPAGHTAREESVTLERAAAADELLLSSSLRGLHPAAPADGRVAPAAPVLVPACR
ncbi:MAG TPA: aminodeoxychorismate synthase component I [Thermoleophilaceae bacterium]|nr:aminodeoxychorismate synthase component I [Thermoleophilaceae bacterium]